MQCPGSGPEILESYPIRATALLKQDVFLQGKNSGPPGRNDRNGRIFFFHLSSIEKVN